MSKPVMPDNRSGDKPLQDNLIPEGYEYIAEIHTAEDALLDICDLCESLPDRVYDGQTAIWAETVNAIYAVARQVFDEMQAAQHDGGAK